MRVVIQAIAVVTLASLGVCVYLGYTRSSAALKFSSGQAIDLGRIPAGLHDLHFDVINDGDESMPITLVEGSCKCTQVRFAHETPLRAGERRRCEVTVNAEPETRQTAMVFFHTLVGTEAVAITFEAFSAIDLTVTRADCVFRRVPPGRECSGSVQIRAPNSKGDLPARWRFVPASGIIILRERVETAKGLTTYSLDFRTSAVRVGQATRGRLELTVGAPPLGIARIPYEISARPDVRVEPYALSAKIQSIPFDLGRVHCHVPVSWELQKIETPDWIGSYPKAMEDGELLIALRAIRWPPREMSAETITLVLRDAEGEAVRCAVRVAAEVSR